MGLVGNFHFGLTKLVEKEVDKLGFVIQALDRGFAK